MTALNIYVVRRLPCAATVAAVTATETFAVADDAQPRVDGVACDDDVEGNDVVVLNAAALCVWSDVSVELNLLVLGV